MIFRNGRYSNSPIIETQCNTLQPILSQGNSLTIEFHTDGSVQKSGFNITIEKITHGELDNNYDIFNFILVTVITALHRVMALVTPPTLVSSAK